MDYGVFTFYLLGALKEGEGALTVGDTFERIRKPVVEFIPKWRGQTQDQIAGALKKVEEALGSEKDEKKLAELKRVKARLQQAQEDTKMFDQAPVFVDDITPPFHLRPAKAK
jgi:hypothetical protein